MNYKKLTLMIASILLVGIIASFGIVSAQDGKGRVIGFGDKIQISDFTAGTETDAVFTFNYTDEYEKNKDGSPFILELNISNSKNPVWRDDFSVEGYVLKKSLISSWDKNISLECREYLKLIDHSLGEENISGKNGSFYCFNNSADLELNERDEVHLSVMSNPALYPGDYNLTAKLYYLNDTYDPEVEILSKDDFENVYYKSGNNIEVEANISDVNLDKEEIIGKIYWNESQTKLGKNYEDELYYFSETLPDEIPEGNHTIEVFAKDIFGNSATDNTRLLIDETPPEIQLIQPTDEDVYQEILPVELDVTDEKAGVDKDSVEIRLREIKNGTICPTTGGSIGNYSCTTTEWIKLDLNETTGNFEKEVNTTKYNLDSGEYWLDAKAKDTLGNEAWWVQEGE